MRHILTSLVLVVFLFPALASGETRDDLVAREGLFYKKFTDVPFTGEMTGLEQGQIKDGVKDGPWVSYYKDGTVNEEYTEIFKDGVRVD